MNAFSKIDMGEVTRLTQAGKLAEAMALLQGHTASSIAQGSPGLEVPRLTQGIKRPSPPLPTIDMVAPSAPGGAWTAPTQFKQLAPGNSSRPLKAAGAPDLAQMMLGLRGLPKLGALSSVGDGKDSRDKRRSTCRRGLDSRSAPSRTTQEVGPIRCTCPAVTRASPSRSWSCCTAALRTQTTLPRAPG